MLCETGVKYDAEKEAKAELEAKLAKLAAIEKQKLDALKSKNVCVHRNTFILTDGK